MHDLQVFKDAETALRVEARFSGDTVWLTQKQLAEIYQTSIQNITKHTKNIFDKGELSPDFAVKDFLIAKTEGRGGANSPVKHYNLDMLIAIGCRAKSNKAATRFRIWAMARLKETMTGRPSDDLSLAFYEAETRRIDMETRRIREEGRIEIARERLRIKEMAEKRLHIREARLSGRKEGIRGDASGYISDTEIAKKFEGYIHRGTGKPVTKEMVGKIAGELCLKGAEGEGLPGFSFSWMEVLPGGGRSVLVFEYSRQAVELIGAKLKAEGWIWRADPGQPEPALKLV